MTDLADTLWSRTSEEALIGSVLINPSVWDELDIESSHFYVHANRYIWESMEQIIAGGGEIDFVTVCQHLDKRKKLAEIGGSAMITALIAVSPTSMHASSYAMTIKELWARRQVLIVAQKLASAAADKESSLDDRVANLMAELTGATNVNRGAVHWSIYLEKAHAEALERADDPGGCWGLQTGFRDFDIITGGLQETELMLVTAEPGIGKSIWTTQMAKQLAELAGPGAVYSLEMLGSAVARRALSGVSQVPTRVMKSGMGWTGEQWAQYGDAIGDLNGLPIYMTDADGWTTTGIKADLSRLKRQAGIRWFVLDYSYMLTDGDGKLNEIDKTALIIGRLKAICRSLHLAGVVIHSQNKAGIRGEAGPLAGLRGSGQVIYDADLILTMSNPDKAVPNVIRFEFGKGRELDNPRKYFDLVRLPELPWFSSVTVEKTVNLNE